MLWGIVAMHLFLMGFVLYYSVTRTTEVRDGNRYSTNRTTTSGLYVTGKWTGGYESDFQWHDKLMAELVKSRAWPLANVLLTILAAMLAIVVKVEVIRRLAPPPEPPVFTPLDPAA